MRTTTISRALLALACVVSILGLAPVTASAREGARSVGGGIKCYTAYLQQADGSYKYTQVCYKGV